jgi:hypothetical protein
MQKMALSKEKLTLAAEKAWDAFLGCVPHSTLHTHTHCVHEGVPRLIASPA